jgi:hypothetical protein
MSGNKVNNKLDFSNVKQTQLDPGQTLKGSFSELQSALRSYDTNAILKDAYTDIIQTTDVDGRPLSVEYWQATAPSTDKLQFSADVAGSKAGTYFTLQEYTTKKTHTFYYVVSGSGVAPGVGDIETPINIATNDPASVITFATKTVLESADEFIIKHPSLLASYLEISYMQFGDTALIDVGTSGFVASRLISGESFKVGEVELEYSVDGDPVYNGNTLKDLIYNVYTASFDAERSDITVTATVDLAPLISKDPVIYNVTMTTAGTEYNLTLPLETKRFKLNIRDHLGKYTVSWISGGPVITKSPGSSYTEEGLEVIAGKDVLYFTGTKDNIVMEIITWK